MPIEDPLPRQGVEALFHQALELDSSDRMAFLSRSCHGDAQLQHEVLSLIEAFEKEKDFLEKPLPANIFSGPESFVEGQKFGHYQINHVIGHGGMGDVYLADDTVLGRKVALKLLPASFSSSESRLARFRMEAKTASSLNHPGIMTVYEIGQEQGLHYIAAEYVEGSTVRGLLADGSLPVEKALDIAFQVARALAVAHAAGIVHRDIKPENIMVRPDGFVKVLDFGLAKPAENLQMAMTCVATLPGVLLGTVDYMSPEQARGLALDTRTDLFSLGTVLYEMLAGKAAFKGKTPTDTLALILEREPTPLSEINPLFQREIEEIIKRLLAKERGQRYQSAAELAEDLQGPKKRIALSVTTPAAIGFRLKWGRWAIAGIMATVMVAASLWLMYSQGQRPAAYSAGVVLTLRVTISGTERQNGINASFDSLGNLNLRGSKRFRLHLTTTQPGHLYVINESLSGNRKSPEFITLFPSPAVNLGLSLVLPNQEISIPPKSWLYLDTSIGIEKLQLIWSHDEIGELEDLQKYIDWEHKGLVTSSKSREELARYFSVVQNVKRLQTFSHQDEVRIQSQGDPMVLAVNILDEE